MLNGMHGMHCWLIDDCVGSQSSAPQSLALTAAAASLFSPRQAQVDARFCAFLSAVRLFSVPSRAFQLSFLYSSCSLVVHCPGSLGVSTLGLLCDDDIVVRFSPCHARTQSTSCYWSTQYCRAVFRFLCLIYLVLSADIEESSETVADLDHIHRPWVASSVQNGDFFQLFSSWWVMRRFAYSHTGEYWFYYQSKSIDNPPYKNKSRFRF